MGATGGRVRSVAFVLLAGLVTPGCAGVFGLDGRNTALERSLASAGPDGGGLARFVDDDFGNLKAYTGRGTAAPWKLYSTALLIAEAPSLGLPVEAASLRPALERFGFLFPDAIDNGDGVRLERTADRPLGQAVATMRSRVPGLRLEMRTTSCAACHAGVLYDAQGRPTRRAWLGAPNTSIDFQGYGGAILAGLRRGIQDERAFLAAIERVHPGLGRGERLLYRRIVLPRVREALRTTFEPRSQPFPFDAGGPGLPNALAVFKSQIGLIPPSVVDPREVAFTSTPGLWSRSFRSSLLCDGSYGAPRRAALPRGVPGRGDARAGGSPRRGDGVLHPDRADPAGRRPWLWPDRRRDRARGGDTPGAVFGGAAAVPGIRGRIAGGPGARRLRTALRRLPRRLRGRAPAAPRLVPNRRVPQERWETDASRWAGVDDAVLAWRDARPRHPFARHVDLERTGGYVAPILDGVWITAPYLHNGSVPTLHHLMHPDERPERFEVGGHALDYSRMGIALVRSEDGTYRYPTGNPPGARSVVRDTRQPGLSNRGHRQPFTDMSEAEKRAVLEFLKTL